MKYIYYCIFFPLLFLAVGCKSEKSVANNDIKSVLIDPDNYDRFIDISPSLDDSLKLVCLQVTDNCILSQIKKIKIQDDKIFISDKSRSGVFVFDMNGKFIKRIGNIGAGPGEFLYMQDFWVAGKNSICIHDLYGFKNITYDINNNTFSETKYEKGLYHLETIKFDDVHYYISNYYLSEYGNYNLYRIDKKNDVKPFILFNRENAKKVNWTNRNYSSKYKDKSLLIYPMNDTIYEITKQNVRPCYKVTFSKRYIPDRFIQSNKSDIFISSRKNNFIIGFDYFQNSKEYILARYVDNNMFRYLMLNKENLDYKIGESFIISKFGNVIFYNYYTGENDEFIISLDAEDFRSNWEVNCKTGEYLSSDIKKKFESIAVKAQDEDNPIVLIFKFK